MLCHGLTVPSFFKSLQMGSTAGAVPATGTYKVQLVIVVPSLFLQMTAFTAVWVWMMATTHGVVAVVTTCPVQMVRPQ